MSSEGKLTYDDTDLHQGYGMTGQFGIEATLDLVDRIAAGEKPDVFDGWDWIFEPTPYGDVASPVDVNQADSQGRIVENGWILSGTFVQAVRDLGRPVGEGPAMARVHRPLSLGRGLAHVDADVCSNEVAPPVVRRANRARCSVTWRIDDKVHLFLGKAELRLSGGRRKSHGTSTASAYADSRGPKTRFFGKRWAENGREVRSHHAKLVSLAEDHVCIVEHPGKQRPLLSVDVQDARNMSGK